ncbi:hypothetical protein O0L34_g7808 [Tuta absoluta]|nr:hypothetical protein O0L34_g7808 [Tuta absoluta]
MDFSRKILDRSAIPETVKRVVVLVPPIASQLLQSAGALADITNTEKRDHADHGRSPQVASHALVFMLCGVRKLVKQPVAFYLSGSSVTADRLAVIIKQVLRRCFDSDINISATVCDMDGVNRRALGILGATVKKPIIEIDDHKVVSLFDPPHLLKCFRNLFLKYDVKHTSNICDGTGKGVAKWSHIQQFFELDKNPNFVFAPALTSEHLAPNAKQKMRVKLAAQVLSHSVAAGMFAKISQGT